MAATRLLSGLLLEQTLPFLHCNRSQEEYSSIVQRGEFLRIGIGESERPCWSSVGS